MPTNTDTTMIKQLSDGGPDGTLLGIDTSDKIGFYGLATPIVQRAAAAQATTAVAVSSSFGATQLAALQEVMNVLIALGLMKGSA